MYKYIRVKEVDEMKIALMKNSKDNVATVLQDVDENQNVNIVSTDNQTIKVITANERIPYGHKISLFEIEKEITIKKGGYTIGTTYEAIGKGRLVHVHNVRSGRINFPDSIIDEINRQMKLK